MYAEVRFAPELHTEKGLSLDEIVEAVQAGFERATAETGIVLGILCTAMRHQARSLEIAELAVRHREGGVVGFDIAGAEAGNPPTRHLDAFQYIQRENFHFTIHAGEAYGPPSIWEAVQYCGAERLGHGCWPATSATDASRSRCALPRTSTPAQPSRSGSTRSTSSSVSSSE